MKKYHWKKITENAAFAPRDGAGAVVLKDRMWLLGGWNPTDKIHFPKICNSEVWSSSDGQDWKLETLAAPWEPRHCAGYVVHQGKMWVVGGDSNQGHHQFDVWSSEDGVHWEQVCDHVPWGPRSAHCFAAFAGKIWVIGGQTIPKHGPVEEIFYSDVWSSEDGKNWIKVADDLPWGPRGMIGGQVVFNDRIWLLGGGTYETPTVPKRVVYNDVWSTGDGKNWQRHAETSPWAARQYHEVAVFDGRMWVMEGYSPAPGGSGYSPESGNRNDVWHSDNGVDWTELPDSPWPHRHAASVFVFQDALWLVAGNNMGADVWKLSRVAQ